jgi:uncharacterized protein YbbC (DUF1343 family)
MLPYVPGITALLDEHQDWIEGRRIALLSHRAAVDQNGRTTAELLHRESGATLVALFAPEHGYDSSAPAGQATPDSRHPEWNIPIYSLYGTHRKPTPEMLRNVDALIFDLQDIGARPYTYVSSLRCLLESAAAVRKRVIVCDRPIPLPSVLDGPLLNPALESFIACLRAPMTYGMTPGETALWLRATLGLSLDLRIARLRGYARQPLSSTDWPQWIPPSPRILSWDTARCFVATVFTEALPHIDSGSGTPLVFQVLGAPPVGRRRLADALNGLTVPGVNLQPLRFTPTAGLYAGNELDGVRLLVADPQRFRPAATAVAILARLQKTFGADWVWSETRVQPGFFDQLFGDRTVREALLDGESAEAIIRRWESGLAEFRASRATSLLYGEA